MKALIDRKTKKEHYYLEKSEIEEIKNFIIETCITQKELANKMGISEVQLSNVIAGKTPVGTKVRKAILEVVGIKLVVRW